MQKTNIKNKSIENLDSLKKRDDIYNDENYKKLYDSFYSLFNRHGRNKKDNFDNQVWFLRNYYDSKGNSSLTPKHQQKIFDIFNELNQNKNANQSDSLIININVDSFIYKISEALIEYYRLKRRSMEKIQKFNIEVEINNIRFMLEFLKKRILAEAKVDVTDPDFKNIINKDLLNSVNNSYKSKANFTLKKIENFAYGEFDVKISIKEIDLKYFNETETVLKPIFNEEIKITQNKDLLITPIKFTEYEFHYCDEQMYNTYPFCGTSFLTYQIIFQKRNVKYGVKNYMSKVRPLLDLVLNKVDEVRNILKNPITSDAPLKIQTEDEEYMIHLDFSMQLDDLTRFGILNRLNGLFKEVLNTKSENENKIDELLELFPEIENEVKSILDVKSDEKDHRQPCCDCKII